MPKEIHILLVEDSKPDAMLLQDTLLQNNDKVSMSHVWDGEQCLSYLKGKNEFAKMPRPDLILMDLNMPKMNGLEALEEIKKSDEYRDIPVIILTVSSDGNDILKSYRQYASCFISKPLNLDQFNHMVKAIEIFWLSIVTFPRQLTYE